MEKIDNDYDIEKPSGIARRSIESAMWNYSASLSTVVVLFIRSIVLARWLPVEVFGIYALAGSVVGISAVIPKFGMSSAFLHRSPETRDEEHAAAQYFTLILIFTLAWGALLIVGAFMFTISDTRTALLLLTATTFGRHLTLPPRIIFYRRIMHRRLAIISICDALLTTGVALSLASRGMTLWALLSTDIAGLLLNIVGLYVWRPVWLPRLSWSHIAVRYFLKFGSRDMFSSLLLSAIGQIDNLWTALYLGKIHLGFYSRAYTFATYPRRVLAGPLNMVAGGTYAELKGDRKRLSHAFFLVNAFLLRSGFFLAGLMALVAPEFIRVALGQKWLPMLDAFRLMLLYTLLDPVKTTIGSLFVAVGRPEKVMQTHAVQLGVLMMGLYILGPVLGITGVALAVDAMLTVGLIILLWHARSYADFSIRRLLGAPAIALVSGLLIAHGSIILFGVGSDWWTGSVKIVVFTIIYGASLLALEGRQTLDALWWVTKLIFS
jgi:O-antigen/teichoic acid export membrane protein